MALAPSRRVANSVDWSAFCRSSISAAERSNPTGDEPHSPDHCCRQQSERADSPLRRSRSSFSASEEALANSCRTLSHIFSSGASSSVESGAVSSDLRYAWEGESEACHRRTRRGLHLHLLGREGQLAAAFGGDLLRDQLLELLLVHFDRPIGAWHQSRCESVIIRKRRRQKREREREKTETKTKEGVDAMRECVRWNSGQHGQ